MKDTKPEPEAAAIVRNNRGGWSVVVCGHEVGNYATPADAARIARLNGLRIKKRGVSREG